ncbi:MAG: cyclic nucleotide-binding domain-containing protein [Myxococcota bacterium]
MTEGAVAVFDAAEKQLRGGSYEAALGNYLRVVRGVPGFWRARFRIADALLNLKARDKSLEIYKALAWHAIKAGYPLLGLVAVKMAVVLDPGLTDVIEILAQLYSKESDRIGAPELAPSRQELGETDMAGELDGLAGAELIAAAADEALATDTMGAYPDKLPAIPLFSYLDEDAFVAVLAGLQLRRFVKDNVIIQEGQSGDSFFILAEGDVQVSRTVADRSMTLAQLHPGAVFGEMALISKAPRTATVTALGDCELLELKRATLEDQAHKLASVTQALKDFTHARFLANLTATSAVFKPFPPSMRHEIIKRFQDFPVDPGDELIAEGEEGQGLFLVLKGGVEVTKVADGQKVSLAKLKEGDVFGEISLLQESPTTATCTAITRGELLFLPKRDFAAVMGRHPELRDELSKITAERIKKTKELLDPEQYELIEDDDLIML